MKHRGISWLLVLTFLLSVFMFCTTAFAASASQGDVTAELTTDKADYAVGDEVEVALKISNNGQREIKNIRTELILPEGLRLKEGTLVSAAFDLAAGQNKDVDYVADIPTTTSPIVTTTAGTTATTVAGTTTPGSSDGPSDTGDISLYIFGALAVFSLVGLVVVMGGFKGLLKNRWFVIILCLALLMPVLAPVVSMAAGADKSFTVSADITVDGAPAVISAKVSYNVDEEYIIEGDNELVYKQDGSILFAFGEGEKGYFLPSDISYDGATTTKDGTYRPEVYAPYIEMLLGSYLETTTKNGQVDGTKLFNADAAKDVLIGATKDAASAEALALIEKNQWIITEIDGKLVVTGWYDNATVAAVKYLYNVVKDADDVTLNLPIIGGLEYVHGNMPIIEDATYLNGMDSEQGNIVLRYEGDADVFAAYTEKLEDGGWTLYHDNTLYGYKNAENLFATYVQGEDVIHVAYIYNSLGNATEEEKAEFSSAMNNAFTAAFRSVDNEIRIILETTETLFPVDNGEALDLSHVGGVAQPEQMHLVNLFTPYSDGNDVGACMIYTLADGSFFVWDGGIATDANIIYKTLKTFNKRDDGIVIAGWVLTHDHNDHTGAFDAFANSDWAKEVTVEKIIVNRAAASYSWRGSNDPYGYSYGFSGVIGRIESYAGKFKGETQIVVPHMGQIIELRNLNIEVISAGEEDVFPVIINNDNAWSLTANITYDGIDQTITMLADSALDQTYNIWFPCLLNELDGDIIQTAHHGLGGQTSRLYPIFNKNLVERKGEDAWHVALWNTSDRSLIENNGTVESYNTTGDKYMRFYTNLNKGLRPQYGGYVVEDIIADSHVKTLTFPYEPGTYTKTYITGNKSNFFDAENIKVGYIDSNNPSFGDIAFDGLKALNADLLVLTGMDTASSDVDTLAQALGYTFVSTTDEHVILSRIPVAKSEKVTGTEAIHAVLDADGLAIDVYAGQFDAAAAGALISAFAPEGEYWVIIGNMDEIVGSAAELKAALSLAADPVKAGLDGDVYDAYANAGSVIENVAEADGVYTFNLKLSRKVLATDLVVGEFDDVPTVGQWWVNYLNQTTTKEQVARWLLASKHEVVALVHTPSELQDDATAQAFAELVGYPYYYVVKIPNANGSGPYGHMILSAYPLEIKDDIIIRSEADASTSPNKPAESYGHVIVDMTSTDLNTKLNFIFGDMDSNNNNGLQMSAQRTALEAAIQGIVEDNGLPFVLLSGYDNSHIAGLSTYAGQAVNTHFDSFSNGIACSATIPMSGRDFAGTTAFPRNGASPIKISIPNVDPYVMVDLAAIPEYTVTVENGVGGGLFQINKTVTITAGKAPYGKQFEKWVVTSGTATLADPTASKTTFVMGDTPVTVKATYKDVPVQVKTPTGDSVTLKVAVEPTFRYSLKWNLEGSKDMILNHYRDVNADVLALTLIDKNVASYNGVDVVGQVTTALADLYEYSYYAPGNKVGSSGDLTTGESTYGHLILSKYPITFSENIFLTDNGGAAEDRTVNHSVIQLAENTFVDLYATHIGTASAEWPVFAANFNQKGDYFMILGNTKIAGSGSTADSYLGTTGTTAGCGNHITMLGSQGITFNGQCAADSSVSSVLTPNMDPLHATTVTIPLLSEAVTKYAVNVDGVNQGYYAAGEAVTLTAPIAPAGYKFTGWQLPASVTLSDGTAQTDATIKFNMPAEIANFSCEFVEVPTVEITFNANGGYGTMDAMTAGANEVNPLPESGFIAPAGMIFKGWATSANATTGSMTLTPTEDTEVFAVWEYKGFVRVLQWSFNYNDHGYSEDAMNKAVNWIKTGPNADVVALSGVDLNGKTAAEEAAIYGFPYGYYVAVYDGAECGTLLMSKSPITEVGTIAVAKTADNKDVVMGHAQITVDGRVMDVFFGMDRDFGTDIDRDGLTQTAYTIDKTNVINAINAAAAAGRPSVLLGHDLRDTFEGNHSFSHWVDAGGAFTAVLGFDWTTANRDNNKKAEGAASYEYFNVGNSFKVAPMVYYSAYADVSFKPVYTVSFDANGGTGSMDAVVTGEGAYTLPACGFTGPGVKVFKGWATSADATEVLTSLNITADTKLYAIWVENLFDVTVNGTKVGSFEVGDTIKVTAPSADTGKTFAGWTGFDGVTVKNNASTAHMTLEFVMPNKDLELTANYANVNTGASYPTIPAIGSAVEELKITYSWGIDNKETVISELTKSMNKGYKVAVYLNTKLPEADVAEIAAASGCYYLYSKGNHFLLSVYPFAHNDTFGYVSGQDRTYNYVTLYVNGTPVDLYFGENNGGTGEAQNKSYVEPWIKHHASKSSNPFFFISYSATSTVTDVFVGLDRDAAANEDGWINVLRSGGTSFVGAEAKSAKIDRGYIYHATFNVAKKTTNTVNTWWAAYSNSNAMSNRGNFINTIKTENPDIMVFANVNPEIEGTAGSAAAEAAAYGYNYYSYVKTDAEAVNGTLLMSRYPIVEKEEFAVQGKNYKWLQIVMAGRVVDVYFGSYANSDASVLADKVVANYNATKNMFIVAGVNCTGSFCNEFEMVSHGGKQKPSFYDNEDNLIVMTRAFRGDEGCILVSSPLTTEDINIAASTLGYTNTAGIGDWMVSAPVVFPD